MGLLFPNNPSIGIIIKQIDCIYIIVTNFY